VRTVLVPERNRPDLSDLPEEVTRALEIRPVESLDQVLAAALLEPEERRAPRRAPRSATGARA